MHPAQPTYVIARKRALRAEPVPRPGEGWRSTLDCFGSPRNDVMYRWENIENLRRQYSYDTLISFCAQSRALLQPTIMAAHCTLCAKVAKKSYTRSHSMRQSLRKQKPNLQTVYYRGQRVPACTKCIQSLRVAT